MEDIRAYEEKTKHDLDQVNSVSLSRLFLHQLFPLCNSQSQLKSGGCYRDLFMGTSVGEQLSIPLTSCPLPRFFPFSYSHCMISSHSWIPALIHFDLFSLSPPPPPRFFFFSIFYFFSSISGVVSIFCWGGTKVAVCVVLLFDLLTSFEHSCSGPLVQHITGITLTQLNIFFVCFVATRAWRDSRHHHGRVTTP